MKIQYASDIHLEFLSNRQFIESKPFEVTGEILVLAGDSFYLNETGKTEHEFWDWASENYRQVLLIPGNHEYYGGYDILTKGESWEWKFRDNVGYYQNKVVTIDDVDFILTTLWANIIDEAKGIAAMRMNDFRRIICDSRRFTPFESCNQHNQCLNFLQKSVEESKASKIVVVTHHLPSFQCFVRRPMMSMINFAYATNLEEFIENSRINLWIHGHNHENKDVTIGNTLITANHIGYVDYGQHIGFDGSRFVEI